MILGWGLGKRGEGNSNCSGKGCKTHTCAGQCVYDDGDRGDDTWNLGTQFHIDTLYRPYTTECDQKKKKPKNKPKNLCIVKPITVIYVEYIPFVPNYRETP